MKTEIKLKKGYGSVDFSMGIKEVMEILGEPSEVEQIGEEMEMPATVMHYDELELSFFFECNENEVLVCINIENTDTTLFGEKIMGKSKKFITDLMNANKIYEQTMDKEVWDEERISYDKYAIDFFFNEDKLESITIGR